jgi:hypothetical protein
MKECHLGQVKSRAVNSGGAFWAEGRDIGYTRLGGEQLQLADGNIRRCRGDIDTPCVAKRYFLPATTRSANDGRPNASPDRRVRPDAANDRRHRCISRHLK